MTSYTSVRWANEEQIGILFLAEGEPALFVDQGELYDAAIRGDYGEIGPVTIEENSGMTEAEILEQARENAVMERSPFAGICANAGLITWPEATAWGAMQSIPAIAQEYIDSLPTADQEEATHIILTSPRVRRLDPYVQALASIPALNLTAAQLDVLFGIES